MLEMSNGMRDTGFGKEKEIKKHSTDNEARGTVVSVNISEKKGVSKKSVDKINLVKDYGVENDAHGGGVRQVSLLTVESAANIEGFKPGMFAENITIEQFDLGEINIGDKIKIGDTLLELTQIGKDCPRKCSIYYKLGDCIMPKLGMFFKVIEGGEVKQGGRISKSD